MQQKMIIRKTMLSCWLLLIASGIIYIFWHYEWKYSLPTKIPVGYTEVPMGTLLNAAILPASTHNKPVFLHFFNPACPCSRFNIPHFKSLVKKYGDKIQFACILINTTTQLSEKEVQEKYDLRIPVYEDNGIARACGVYSTPQAAIINTDKRLYFRGNYNKATYCTDEKTNYAQIAIDSLFKDKPVPLLGLSAYKSYGCSLSECKK